MSRGQPDLRVFGVQKNDPGYIYIVEDRGRYKIGKSKDGTARLKAAKTWLPDMNVIGVKPFWNISELERRLHTGFGQNWYQGEWFQFAYENDRELLTGGFLEFSDTDRDWNSVDFIYWSNSIGLSELIIERHREGLTLPKYLLQTSWTKKK